MADADLRSAERHAETPDQQARLLVARLRAGQLSRERVALAAVAGDESARLVAEWPAFGNLPGSHTVRRWDECAGRARILGDEATGFRARGYSEHIGTIPEDRHYMWCPGSLRYRHPDPAADLSHWLTVLESAARPLPDVVGREPCPACVGGSFQHNDGTSEPCRNCDATGYVQGERDCECQDGCGCGPGDEMAIPDHPVAAHDQCTDCDGTGRVPYTVSAPRYVLTLAAVGAGWEARCAWVVRNNYRAGGWRQGQVEAVLDAADAWLRCPCEEHEDAWAMALQRPNGRDPLPAYLPGPAITERDPKGVILDAARLAGDPTVRSAVFRRVVEWALR